jgi:hypothetical protein
MALFQPNYQRFSAKLTDGEVEHDNTAISQKIGTTNPANPTNQDLCSSISVYSVPSVVHPLLSIRKIHGIRGSSHPQNAADPVPTVNRRGISNN